MRLSRKKSKKCRLAAVALGAFAVFLLAILYYDNVLMKLIADYANIRAVSVAQQVINSAIESELSEKYDTYSDLVSITSDQNGAISAISTDGLKVSMLKSAIAQKIADNFEATEYSEMNIPLGTLLDIGFLTGHGPEFSVHILPVGAATIELGSEFEAAGINQTVHRVILTASVHVSVILQGSTHHNTGSVEAILSETVIVGSVPEVYASLE